MLLKVTGPYHMFVCYYFYYIILSGFYLYGGAKWSSSPPKPLKGRFLSVYNQLEGRASNDKDNNYMEIIILGAIIILFLCLMLSGKKV